PSMGDLWDALRGALAMEPARAFGTTDSSRGSVTALAPSQRRPPGVGVGAGPDAAFAPTPIVAGGGGQPYRTMPTPGPSAVLPPRRAASAGLFATFGIAAVVAGLALVAGYVVVVHNKEGTAKASASAAAVVPAPPPPVITSAPPP